MFDEFDFDAPKQSVFNEDSENRQPFFERKPSNSRISNLNSSKSRENRNGLLHSSSRTNCNRDNHNQNDKYSKPMSMASSSKIIPRQLSSTLQSNRSSELFQPDISEIPNTSQRYQRNVAPTLNDTSTVYRSNLFKDLNLDESSKTMAMNYVNSPRTNVKTADISEMRNTSQRSEKNVSATLNGSSTVYRSNLFKDLNLDESSKTMAIKYVNSPRTNIKTADISERSSKLLDSLKARGTNNNGSSTSKPQNGQQQKQFSLEPLVGHYSSFTRPTTPASKGPEIAIKPEPISHWGFVALGQEVQAKVFVQNMTSQVLQISPVINDATGSFKLTSNETVHINPNTAEEFSIIFSPKDCKRYRSKIKFVITSTGNQYYHTLFGYGGTADIRIVQKHCIQYFPRNLIYRCTPPEISHFTFEVENIGNRSTFVHIASYDEIENDVNRIVTVEPESFCLAGKSNNPNDPTKRMITVTYKHQRSSLDSDGSFSSSSSGKLRNRLLTLKVYFGDERLRQRASKYSDEINRHQHYCGLLLTKTSFLLNGEEINASDRDPVSKQDIEMLKAQTRVLTIIVGDDRLTTQSSGGTQSLTSRPPSTHSLCSSKNGFYIPQCNKNDLEESMISNVTGCDRTFFK
uniref:Uncharacterized protein n=1 Tax=Panagrolaimus sp. ES5 TaxID=591445 RepID=A0AC34F6S3_9BILA